jgi:hypothetical protein
MIRGDGEGKERRRWSASEERDELKEEDEEQRICR